MTTYRTTFVLPTLFFTLLFLAAFVFIPQDVRGQESVYPVEPDFGDMALRPSDDSFTDRIPLGFEFTLYGQTYDRFWINNNGNVTFTTPLEAYTPFVFPNDFGAVIIAPFFADVDTSGVEGGSVYLNNKTQGRVVVTWDRVGYYNAKTDKRNSFQLILEDDQTFGFTDGDHIIFVYGDLEWTTGEDSDGVHAAAGFDSGNGVDALLLAGSFTEDILSLANTINVFNAPGGKPGDMTPPQTTIKTAPADGEHLSVPTVTFEWTGSDNVTNSRDLRFEVRLDSAASDQPTTKTSRTYTSLQEGSHTVEIRALDENGNADDTPATVHFFIDLTPPQTKIVSGLSDESWTNQTAATFEWIGSDTISTQEELRYAHRLDDNDFTEFGSDTKRTFEKLPEGKHTFVVQTRDKAGHENKLTINFTVDVTPPDTEITSGPNEGALINTSEFTLKWTGSDNLTSADRLQFAYRIDDNPFSPFSSDTSHTFTGFRDGKHTLTVKAQDLAMNEDKTPATRTFEIDFTPPTTTITAGVGENDHVNTGEVTFKWAGTDNRAAEGNLLFSYRLDSGNFSEFGQKTTLTIPNLSEGTHTFEVRAKDEAGNIGTPVSRTFVIDFSPPDIQIIAPTKDEIVTLPVTISWNGKDNFSSESELLFATQLDREKFSEFSARTSIPIDGLAAGKHTFAVKARDKAGNENPKPVTITFIVAAIVVSPSSIDFGNVNVGKAAPVTVSVRNTGDAPLSVTGIHSTLGEVLSISETTFSIVPGETHHITLTLTPSAVGEITGTLTITRSDPGLPTVEVAITANALLQGDVNRDGVVNLLDLVIVGSQFGQRGADLRGDVNGDGTVDIFDFIIVGKQFEQSSTALMGDANGDGVVNIFDLVHMGNQLGKSDPDPKADVNSDGTVNELDLVFVSLHFGEGGTAKAPSTRALGLTPPSPEEIAAIQQVLTDLERVADPSQGTVVARQFLRAWLANAAPIVTETKLLPNYPNPFNPETWLPYQLAEDAHMKIEIYNVRGELVRTLDLGFKTAGYYLDKGRAAHWDGRNDFGERIASGFYFYHIHAGKFSATRKMLVVK